MARTIDALRVCANKLKWRKVERTRLVATEACRMAGNGEEFIARVKAETGLALEIIDRETEATLAATGAEPLIDPNSDSTLVFDIGGGIVDGRPFKAVQTGGPSGGCIPAEHLDKEASFFRPTSTEVLRDLRRIELAGGWPAVQYDQTSLAGLYEASVGEPPLKLKFAAQADPAESALDELSPAQLATLREVAQVVTWSPDLSLRSLVERGRTGVEFWLPVLLACLLLAATETFLGQWFSRSK